MHALSTLLLNFYSTNYILLIFQFKACYTPADLLTIECTYPLDVYLLLGYYYFMIKSFADKETEKIYNQVYSKKLPTDIQRIALRKLIMINNASGLNDLKVPPSNHLEKLSGDRKGQYSIRINDQWRICFKWEGRDAYDVEIVDYH